MEDKFWATKGEPSRTLRFSENLLDEEVNLGDMSTDSFGTPIAVPAQVPRLSHFADPDFVDEPTITQLPPLDLGDSKGRKAVVEQVHKVEVQSNPSPSVPSTPKTPSVKPLTIDTPTAPTSRTTETPGTKHRKIKMNPELEKIVVSSLSDLYFQNAVNKSFQSKIWSSIGDIILPSYNSDKPHLSVKDTMSVAQFVIGTYIYTSVIHLFAVRSWKTCLQKYLSQNLPQSRVLLQRLLMVPAFQLSSKSKLHISSRCCFLRCPIIQCRSTLSKKISD